MGVCLAPIRMLIALLFSPNQRVCNREQSIEVTLRLATFWTVFEFVDGVAGSFVYRQQFASMIHFCPLELL